MRKTALLVAVLAALAAGGCGEDHATDIQAIRVPDDYPTPQEAVDAAEPGELVVIRPGVYFHTERRDVAPDAFPGGLRAALFLKDGVRVLGLGPEPGGAVLRDTTAADSSVGVVLASVGNDTFVENLAVEGFAVGVLLTGRDGVVQNLRVEGAGIGIRACRAGAPEVAGCRVTGASSVGIQSEQTAAAFFGANHVRDCVVGVEVSGTGSPDFEVNVLCRNDTGLRITRGATPFFLHNAIRDNRVFGVALSAGAIPRFAENDVYDNGVEVDVAEYDPPLSEPIILAENYWGTTDPDVIAREIRDGLDDPARGAVVSFLPVSPVPRFDPRIDLGALCRAQDAWEVDSLLRDLRRVLAETRPATRAGRDPS